MLRIYLARHGQDQDNAEGLLNGHRDRELTDLGRAQAAVLGQKISELGIHFDAVYASPLKRAFRTAEIVAESAGLPKPVAIPDLIERDFGVMTGVPVSEISKRCAPKILKTEIIVYFLEPERGETFPVLKERAARALDQLKSKHRDGSILVVTHGDVGKMLYAEFYNLDWKEVLTQFHFGNSELLLVSKDSPAAEAHVFKTEQHNH